MFTVQAERRAHFQATCDHVRNLEFYIKRVQNVLCLNVASSTPAQQKCSFHSFLEACCKQGAGLASALQHLAPFCPT